MNLPIETNRLIIRKISLDDMNLILKTDKQEITQKYIGGIKNKTKEERLKFLEKIINDKNNLSLTVSLKDNTPIGLIGINISDNRGNLSYLFDYDYTNKGYCTEACKILIDICFK